MNMDQKRMKQGFIRSIRAYPLIAIGLLIMTYLLGGFSENADPLIPRVIVTGLFYLLVGVKRLTDLPELKVRAQEVLKGLDKGII